MAKKSAKSKGYRKAVGKKPYLTKRDIVVLCLLLAVVAVGAILLFTYDDGALKVKDGKIVDPGENWLIVNGNARGHRYFKLGEVGEIDGYAMEAQPFVTDENLNQFVYTPEDEDSPIRSITISASAYDPARLAEGNARMVAAVEGNTVADIATDSIGDAAYTYYTYTHAYYAADEETTDDAADGEADAASEEAASDEAEDATEAADDSETEPNRFEQAMNAYVDAPRDGSIVIAISASADSAEDYLSEDQLKEALGQAVAAVTLEAEK